MFLERLEAAYEKYGGRIVYPPLFIFFFMLHFISSLGMFYPVTDPNELSVIAVGEWFIGNNWSGVMCSVNYYYGFVQGLLYAPALLIFGDPQACYIAMLAINAVIMSFIPLIAFSCSRRLKAGKVWKSLLIAFVTGAYCCYFAHAKFAWSETSAIVFPWLLLWIMLRAGETRIRWKRSLWAVLLGFCSALSIGAHTRLIAVVLAVFAALAAQRIFYGRSGVPIVSYFISFVGFGALTSLFSTEIQRSLWLCSDPAALNNTAASFFYRAAESFSAEGAARRFFITFFGQLYYFVTATWGVGAIMFSLFGVVLVRCIQKRKGGEEQSFDENTAGTAFFTFFAVVFTVLIGVLYRFGSDNLAEYQDTTLFGRFLDGVIPFALMFVLVILFTRSIELNKLLAATGVLGVIYVAFFSFTLPVILSCSSTRIAPILALYPLQIGKESTVLTFDSLLLTASMTFCVISMFIVVVSCTKKLRSLIISLIILGLTTYSLLFIQNEYLPLCYAESVQKNSDTVELSESVYNQHGAPALTAYNLSRHEALMLQFLNRNITVRITYNIETIPENCYLAVKRDEDVSALTAGRSPFLLVAESSGLRLYAYGERAIAYMQSQDVDENEDENAPLMPEITTSSAAQPPESTPQSTTATTPVSTAATTERTPIVSTYTTPAVLTVPADAFGTDDEWAVIE